MSALHIVDIQNFFTAYAQAYVALDGDAVAGHCAAPMAISQGGTITWWDDLAPVQDNMRKLCAVYRDAGLVSLDFQIEQATPLGDHDAFALVRWRLGRADGSLIQQFRTGYQLHRTAQGTKVVFVTAFDEDLAAMRHSRGNP